MSQLITLKETQIHHYCLDTSSKVGTILIASESISDQKSVFKILASVVLVFDMLLFETDQKFLRSIMRVS